MSARALAAAGFVAFAPDLYHGIVTDQIPEAEALVAALSGNEAEVTSDLATSVAFLQKHARADTSRVAVMEFSLGTSYALDLPVTDPDEIDSVVTFYGTGAGDFSGSQADYLVLLHHCPES